MTNFSSIEQEKHWLAWQQHILNKSTLNSNSSNEQRSRHPFIFHSTIRTPLITPRNATKSHQELSYNESAELYSSSLAGPDELDVVMDKPSISVEKSIVSLHPLPKISHTITTTSPIIVRNNKTVNSKGKSKRPPPVEVKSSYTHLNSPAAAAIPILSSQNEDQHISSETSSEKVADSIPHDFESNSIDIDSQQIQSNINKKNAKISSSTLGRSSKETSNAADAKKDVDIHDISAISTTSSNSLNSPPVTIANNHIFKTLAPPTINNVINIHQNTNYSIESPPTSNKSLDNADALDLQNLSPSNDSFDNPIPNILGYGLSRDSSLGRRSASPRSVEWVVNRKIALEVFGTPQHCSEDHHDVSNCQVSIRN